jgi:hypothetical protein
MGLNRALVDRARRVYEEEQPEAWVEGEPVTEVKHGPWFRVRVEVGRPSEQRPANTGTRFLDGDATLMMGMRYEDSVYGLVIDADGRFRAFGADDKLEVVASGGAESFVWHVNTGVEPIRKRRTVIGFQCGLRRAEAPTAAELVR